MSRFERICCAIDFSAPSAAALEVAAELAGHLGAAITLVHVLDLVARPLPGTPHADAVARAEQEARTQLEDARATVEARFGIGARTVLLAGDPAWELAKLLSSGEYDLAVMGTHGRTGLQRLLVGSVTARVMRDATCPVLVVRAPLLLEGAEPSDDAPGGSAGAP